MIQKFCCFFADGAAKMLIFDLYDERHLPIYQFQHILSEWNSFCRPEKREMGKFLISERIDFLFDTADALQVIIMGYDNLSVPGKLDI